MTQSFYLVTGASKGLGRALALLLAEQGHNVLALARSSSELESIEPLLVHHAPKSASVACDLSQPASIAAAVEAIAQHTHQLAGIVHNAGAIAPVKPMGDVDDASWALSIQVNLIGVQDLTQRLRSMLGGEKRSRVTVISSGASLRPIHSWSAYCVSKAGLDMWSRCLAEEGKNDNISSISVAPGVVDTGMQKEIRSVPSQDFPSLQTFIDLHEEGHLVASETVAGQLLDLVTAHTMEQSGHRFDVRDL
jgi:benzil reductase ((S)-benzoin forming)